MENERFWLTAFFAVVGDFSIAVIDDRWLVKIWVNVLARFAFQEQLSIMFYCFQRGENNVVLIVLLFFLRFYLKTNLC